MGRDPKKKARDAKVAAVRTEWYGVTSTVVDETTKIKVVKYRDLAEATERRRVPTVVVTRDQLNQVVLDLLPK